MGKSQFLKLERKTQFIFIAHISSKVSSLFICGLIDLKFGEEVRDSLIFNLNGGDRIWRSRQFSFNPRTELLFWCVFYPDNFDHELRLRLICGSIEPIFGEHVQNSLIFILNGGDWIWSSKQLYFSPRIVMRLVRSLHCSFMQRCWNCQD